jgi:arylsulfatase A-like enzyme
LAAVWPLRLACLALVAGTLAVVVAGWRPASPDAAVRPNILLVSIDSLRADHVRSYGYGRDTTPTIDRLARRGVLFEHAISSASWTVPAHMTMLTALPPEVHGVSSYLKALSPDAVTLAEVLRDAGYETAAFVSGPTVMAQYGFAQGFAKFDESMVDPSRARSRIGITSPGLVALVDRFLQGWSDSGRRAPFFVFLHMWDVHYDYAPPAPYDRMFDPDYTGDLTSENFERNPRIRRDMDPRDLQHLIALYDGEIRFTDEHLGKVIDRLAALHVLDDTIVAVTSDHGDEFFEHGMKGHAKTLYDEVLHVPMVISYPRRIRFAQRVHAQVRLMDLAPTLLGLAGVAPPPDFGFRPLDASYGCADLSPYVAGVRPRRGVPELPAFSDIQSILGHQRSLRTPAAKLIRYDRPRRGHLATEVFDLTKDPGEQHNLVTTADGRVFEAKLDLEMATWGAAVGSEPQLAVAQKPGARHTARLRSLGYIE